MGVFGDSAHDPRPRHNGKAVESLPPIEPRAERGEVLRITVVGEEILKAKCKPVAEFNSPELSKLIDDMFRTMYVAEGVGLAANQVDVNARIFVYDCPDDDGVRHVGHVINPELLKPAPSMLDMVTAEEGCLSVPGPSRSVQRLERATVTGFDETGTPVTITGTGYFARCLQHETDHLNGRLYLDHLPKADRKDAIREMEELRDEVFARRAAQASKFR